MAMGAPVIRWTAIALLAIAGAAPIARGQDYPARPVRIVVPFVPGGGTDLVARILAQKLGESLGANFIVENRAGAGGIIGTEIVAKSRPDGYTLGVVSASHGINPSVHKKLPYDSIRDFSPVTMLMSGPVLLVVHPSVPARTVKDLIALAKGMPGSLTFPSAGYGTPPHLAGELFKMMAGLDMVHVPYKGNGPAYIDLMAGYVSVMFPSIATAIGHVRTGKLRALAITSKARSRIAPELPTIAESGLPGYEVGSWYGLLAPAETPAPVVRKLQQEIAKVFQLPEVREKLLAQGVDPVANTPEEFAAMLPAEIAKWAKVVKASGMRIE